MSPTPPVQLRVAPPDDAPPQPIPKGLADLLDQLPIDDGEVFWLVSRLVEYSHRLGYADGHARGYRDRDREAGIERPRVDTTQAVRAVKVGQV